ncbi:hypothetical protein SAY87_020817 [Trapa incisa]|uniref:Uncharacterized protein n=1 Tax=Trapa incisa TaxID=236973 RepID=A0AAN7JR80_9MYRT|nr:hypothetical protein SAY87_020817 [Trapa incisa]
MGGICTKRSTVDNAPSGSFPHVNGYVANDDSRSIQLQSHGLPIKVTSNSNPSSSTEDSHKLGLEHPVYFLDTNITVPVGLSTEDDGIPRLSRVASNKYMSAKSKLVSSAKVSEVGSFLGKAGEKAVDVLDTLSSGVSSLHSSGFTSGVTMKGNMISILAFEVANTIVKGANLMQSLSEGNIKHLKEVVLPSEGVQNLISRDMDELLRIAAADKRDELKVFSSEVVRFGNRCKDPQWHNLDRFFEKLGSEIMPQKQLKEEAEAVMQQLMNLVQHTAELYHELHALDRFEQDYQRKLHEDDNPSNAAQRGDSLSILKAELKSQRKHVKTLKKKSLWSQILEEVMEKLVDTVHFLHLEIKEAFGIADSNRSARSCPNNRHKTLGSACLALHYANIITQVDTIVSRPSSVPSNTRDVLYQGLPPGIKSALRSKLNSFQVKEELTIPYIKGEMEKTLQWLVPVALNTTKAHHGFGWVGEWANTGTNINQKPAGQNDLLRIETLYHANKDKTEAYILELVVWLHHLVSHSRTEIRSPVKSPIRSPVNLLMHKPNSTASSLTTEDHEMLRDVNKRKLTPGISKSQEFDTVKTRDLKHHQRLTKSSSHSPTTTAHAKDIFPVCRPSSLPIIDFGADRINALDVIDRVDTIRTL